MSDINIAMQNLHGHSICLCRHGEIIFDDGKGISPMMKFIAADRDLRGYCAADLIVGKAAAMLFVKAGIAEVYGETMSEAGAEYLKSHGIPYSFGTFTDRIVNRKGDGICPMEQTVADISDPEEGYQALKQKILELSANK
ncbi:MAG: DUF1893 domain-containing protein [Lachnospiraceae bacterium]|nr:DUF1893 domain-containing protein [Lachnospiraceae bacterium]